MTPTTNMTASAARQHPTSPLRKTKSQASISATNPPLVTLTKASVLSLYPFPNPILSPPSTLKRSHVSDFESPPASPRRERAKTGRSACDDGKTTNTNSGNPYYHCHPSSEPNFPPRARGNVVAALTGGRLTSRPQTPRRRWRTRGGSASGFPPHLMWRNPYRNRRTTNQRRLPVLGDKGKDRAEHISTDPFKRNPPILLLNDSSLRRYKKRGFGVRELALVFQVGVDDEVPEHVAWGQKHW